MKIYWRKPYVRVQEKNYGSYQFAFVVYHKWVICYRNEDRGPHPEGRFIAIPTSWKQFLRIDLWFIILDFSWEAHEATRS